MTAIPRATVTGRSLTRVLLTGGLIAGPVFVTAFLIDGATRAGYDPIRLPVSLLSVGDDGWIQVVNFVVDGVLLLGFAFGLFTALRERGTPITLGPLLLAVFSLAIIGAGLFSTDPGAGFPPGAAPPIEPTTHGIVHDLVSLVVFTMLPVACFVFARRFARYGEQRWATYSAITGIVLAVGFIAILIAFNAGTPLSTSGGLIQRLWIVAGWGWLSLLGAHLLGRPRTMIDDPGQRGSSRPILINSAADRACAAGRWDRPRSRDDALSSEL